MKILKFQPFEADCHATYRRGAQRVIALRGSLQSCRNHISADAGATGSRNQEFNKKSLINMNNPIDSSFGMFAVGSLKPNSEFQTSSLSAKKLPGGLPVLMGTVDHKEFDSLMRPGGRGSFGLGNMAFNVAGKTRHILTMRAQVEATQLYWLADMSDAEVWAAIDAWRKQKRIPVVFGDSNRVAYTVSEYRPISYKVEDFRREISPKVSREFWDMATTAAVSGFVQMQATTDIPGVKLERVGVNVLVTKRMRRFMNGQPLREKPISANSDSAEKVWMQ